MHSERYKHFSNSLCIVNYAYNTYHSYVIMYVCVLYLFYDSLVCSKLLNKYLDLLNDIVSTNTIISVADPEL